MAPHSSTLAWKIPWMEEPVRLQSMGSLRVGRLSDFTFTFHFHALEKEMAAHSSVLAWRIPGKGEPGGLPSMGSHRVGHNLSDLAQHSIRQGITTIFGKSTEKMWACAPKELSCLNQNSGSFCTKRGGSQVKHFPVPISLLRGCVHVFFPAVIQETFQVVQWERIHLPVQEVWVQSLGQENPLEEEMATSSSILAWKLPWTEEPGGLQSMGSKKV